MPTSGAGDRGVAILTVRGGVDSARSWVEGVEVFALTRTSWSFRTSRFGVLRR